MNVSVKQRFDQYRETLASINDIAALVTIQELGIFQVLLHGARSIAQLEQQTQVSGKRLLPMLELVSLAGFLHLNDGQVSLPEGDEGLYDPQGDYWPRLSGAHTSSLFARLGQAQQVLKTDQPLAAASTGGDVDQPSRDDFLRYFDAWARTPAARVAEVLCQEPVDQLMDLGCGGGTYSFALLQRLAHARATLVDRPNAEHTVLSLASEAGVGDRVRFVSRDILDNPFDPGMSLIFSSNLAHCLGFSQNLNLVRKAAAHLAPGGRLAIKDYNPATTPEQKIILARFEMQLRLFSEAGQLYEPSEVQLWMAMAGLKHEATHVLDDSYLVIGRKTV